MKNRVWIILFLLPTLFLFMLIFLVPLFTVLVTSFTKWRGFGVPEFVGLRNYIELFTYDKSFHKALLNTGLWGLIAAFVHVPFGVLVALVLHKRYPGWKLVRSTFMFPRIIAPSAMAILYTFIFKPGNGLLNSFIRLVGFQDFDMNWFFNRETAFLAVTLTWVFYSAMITLITMAQLSSIPKELYEASEIDGASKWQIDLYINIPLLRNIVGTGMILAVTTTFRQFEHIFLTTQGGPGIETMNLALSLFNNVTNQYRYGYANAIGSIMIVLGVVSVLIISKTFQTNKASSE